MINDAQAHSSRTVTAASDRTAPYLAETLDSSDETDEYNDPGEKQAQRQLPVQASRLFDA